MKFVSARELRNRPGYVRDLTRNDDVVLTADGKPFGVLLGIEDEGLEETLFTIRQARAQRALSRLRRDAASVPQQKRSPQAIQAEIRAVRRKRKSR